MSYYMQTIFKFGNFSPRHILIPALLETVPHESESYNMVQSSISFVMSVVMSKSMHVILTAIFRKKERNIFT